ncbi:MAG: VOC family protein [Clostridia bacterium]|nr:VOC family protein [Clostridia bacterium]
MSDIQYTLAHIGINAANADEAAAVAAAFADAFNLQVKPGNSSLFAGTAVEVMRTPYLGRLGHIAFATPDCEAAVKDLEARGYAVDMDTAKYRPDGTLNAVYLKDEIGGFAVHVLRKP